MVHNSRTISFTEKKGTVFSLVLSIIPGFLLNKNEGCDHKEPGPRVFESGYPKRH